MMMKPHAQAALADRQLYHSSKCEDAAETEDGMEYIWAEKEQLL